MMGFLKPSAFRADLPDAVVCLDNERLFLYYNRCVMEWSKAVQHLNGQVSMDDDLYLKLLELVDIARARTAEAKAAYRKHVAEHGC